MRLATCMWGGALCPLIPVMKTLPRAWRNESFRKPTPLKVTRGYLRFFEPDVFVRTAPGQFEAAGLVSTDQYGGRSRYRDFSKLVRQQTNTTPALDLGVDMFNVYKHLYRTEFQFQKRRAPRNFLFTAGDRIGEAFCETAYGMFPSGLELDYIARGFQDAVDAKPIAPDAEAWREISHGAGFPLHYTAHGLETRFDHYGDPAIFVFDPLSGPDVIDAWNFRLITRDPLLINVHWLEQSRDVVLEMIKANHRPLPTNPNGVMIGTTLHVARSLDAQTVVQRLNLPLADLAPRSFSVQPWYEPLWQEVEDDRIHRPSAVTVSGKTREAQLLPSTGANPTVPAPVVGPDFQTRWSGHGPGWINVVQARSYGANSPFADLVPSAALGGPVDYPSRSIDTQFPTREGYVTFQSYVTEVSRLQLPTREQAVVSWLAGQGLVATPSEAGRITDQVIAALGGLWGTTLVRDIEILKLLDKMARSRVVREGGDSEEFPDSTANAKTWVDTLKRVGQRRRFRDGKTLQRLVEANVLRLGLAASCQHCAKENWYSLDDVATTVRCERCRNDFPYPQGNPQANAWKYRVVGPFATPHFAQGAYCVALSLAYLEHLGTSSPFTYTTSLDLVSASGQRLETDFFAWWGDHGLTRSLRDPATIVGECKSLGTDTFKDKDIARLKALAQAVPGAYLVVATLKTQFSPGEVRRLKALCRWGWSRAKPDRRPSRVIVLTGVELFGNGSLSYDWKQAGGALAQAAEGIDDVFDLTALAEATQRGHLGFTLDEMTALRYPPRRGIPPTARNMLVSVV